jgi:diguanylate cyclase (GGDEF)-like protein
VTSPAARIRAKQSAARAALAQRDTLTELLRDTLGESDPSRIASVFIDRLAAWIPLEGWGVVMADGFGQVVLAGARGVREGLQGPVLAVGTWVIQEGEPFRSGNLARDPRVAGAAPSTVLALPLFCRGHIIGAAVGIEAAPSRRPPQLSPRVTALLAGAFEAVAYGLDQAFRLQRAEAMSVTDDLTGLYNSRFLKEALHREAKRAMRYGRPVTVLFVDLDGFKAVNDTHGHLAGSRTLVEVGAIIRASARESDIVARYGGDEFVVVLPDTGSDGGLVVARRIRDRIAAEAFLASAGIGCRLTASVGVAALPEMGRSAEELLDSADRAMYHVKETGKNNVCLAPRV